MKKIISILALAAFSLLATAKDTITVIYSWTAADTAANFHRSLIEEANRIQDKYNFIFDTRPGAGGSIAATHVLETPNTILATASAFFVRPNFFPNESHDVTKFREIFPQCSAPAVIASKKYKSWSEVPNNAKLSIGMSGMGTTTHLIATQLVKKYPNLIIVPFKSTSEALLGVLNDSTDFSVNFLGDSDQYTTGKDPVHLLGITGNKTINRIVPLSTQGFSKDLEVMNIPAELLVPTSWPDSKFTDVREILLRAGRSQSVLDSYKPDYCQNINQMNDKEIQIWYTNQISDWKRLTIGVLLK
jgi:tripartite-type tricarboxylate transporter receptor subunit TctC